jgi:Sec-independent protein translocase protein TatA
LFQLLLLALIVVIGLVVIGPTLPEGSFIRNMGEGIGAFFSGMGRGFGGGYQPINPAG